MEESGGEWKRVEESGREWRRVEESGRGDHCTVPSIVLYSMDVVNII